MRKCKIAVREWSSATLARTGAVVAHRSLLSADPDQTIEGTAWSSRSHERSPRSVLAQLAADAQGEYPATEGHCTNRKGGYIAGDASHGYERDLKAENDDGFCQQDRRRKAQRSQAYQSHRVDVSPTVDNHERREKYSQGGIIGRPASGPEAYERLEPEDDNHSDEGGVCKAAECQDAVRPPNPRQVSPRNRIRDRRPSGRCDHRETTHLQDVAANNHSAQAPPMGQPPRPPRRVARPGAPHSSQARNRRRRARSRGWDALPDGSGAPGVEAGTAAGAQRTRCWRPGLPPAGPARPGRKR